MADDLVIKPVPESEYIANLYKSRAFNVQYLADEKDPDRRVGIQAAIDNAEKAIATLMKKPFVAPETPEGKQREEVAQMLASGMSKAQIVATFKTRKAARANAELFPTGPAPSPVDSATAQQLAQIPGAGGAPADTSQPKVDLHESQIVAMPTIRERLHNLREGVVYKPTETLAEAASSLINDFTGVDPSAMGLPGRPRSMDNFIESAASIAIMLPTAGTSEIAGPLWKAVARSPFMQKLITAAKFAQPYAIGSAAETGKEGGGTGDQLQSYAETVVGFMLFETGLHVAGKTPELGRRLVEHFETAAHGALDAAEKKAAALVKLGRPKEAARLQATAVHDAAREGVRAAMTKADPETAQAVRENLRAGISGLVDLGNQIGHDIPHASRIIQAGAEAAIDMPATKAVAAAAVTTERRRLVTPAVADLGRIIQESEIPTQFAETVKLAPELQSIYREAVDRKNREIYQSLLASGDDTIQIPLKFAETAAGGARENEPKRQAINAFITATESQRLPAKDALQIATRVRSMAPSEIHSVTRAIRMAQRVGGSESDSLIQAQLGRLAKRELGEAAALDEGALIAREKEIPSLGEFSDNELFRDIENPAESAAQVILPTGASPTLSDVRAELASNGIDLRVREGEGARTFQAFDVTGKPLYETRSLQDALVEAQRRSVPTAEALKPTLVDATPDDSDVTKMIKNQIRRNGLMPPPPGGTGGIGRIPDSSVPGDSGAGGGRFSQGWIKFTRGLQEIGHTFRVPDELVRNYPTLKDPLLDFGNAQRAAATELSTMRGEIDALGLKEGSPGDQAAAAFLDAIDGLRIRTLKPGDKAAWKAAILETARTNKEVTLPRTRAALDALEHLSPKVAEVTQKISRQFRDFRMRGIGVWARETFPEEIGRLKPWVVFEGTGAFSERYATKVQADKAAAKLGGDVRHHLEPTPTEINNRFGSTLSAYFPHLIYDHLDRTGDMQGIIADVPWADPAHLINDLKRTMVIKDPLVRREAFDTLFGPMADDTYTSLEKQVRALLKDARNAVNDKEIRRIPRDLYVKFFNRRAGVENYQRSAVRALQAYSGPVLRDIHLGPQMPKVRAAIESSVASGVDRGILDEVKAYVNDTLGHQRTIGRDVSSYTAGLTRTVYNGVLLGRIGPAISNIIGQTFQVGLPEMGVKHAASALISMSDSSVRAALARIPEIQSVLPSLSHPVRTAFAEAAANPSIRNIKNVVAHMGDFMQMGEGYLRMWAYLGGVSQKMEEMQLGKAGASMKSLFTSLDQLPQVVREDIHRAGTDMTRRVAFFFEPQSLPRALRAMKRIPIIGPPATMFMNFPVNYGNRLLSNVQDAFSRTLPREVRMRAQGKLARMAFFTTMLAGPLGAPIVNEWIDSASELDPGMRGKVKRFLAPYQDYWTNALHGASTQRFSMLRPLTELGDRLGMASGNVVTGNPVVGSIGNISESLWDLATGAPVTHEVQAQRQRVFGDFAQYLDAPKPELNHIPEIIAATGLGMGLGGGAWQDVWNYLSRNATQDALPGPIDSRGKARNPADPLVRSFTGETRSEKESRKNIALLRELSDERSTKLQNYLISIFNPRTGPEEQIRSLKVLLSTPEILTSITPQAIERARQGLEMTVEQQTIASAPSDVIRRLDAQGVFDKMIRNIEDQPPEVAVRRLRVWMTAKERLATGK